MKSIFVLVTDRHLELECVAHLGEHRRQKKKPWNYLQPCLIHAFLEALAMPNAKTPINPHHCPIIMSKNVGFDVLKQDKPMQNGCKMHDAPCKGKIITRKRWRAALWLGWERVACRVARGRGAAEVLLSSLLQRAHYTNGQRSDMAIPLLEAAVAEIKQRQAENLIKSGKPSQSLPSRRSGKTIENLAQDLGISRRSFFQALQVRRA